MVLTQDGAAPERHTLMRLLNTAPDDEVTALLAALAVQSSVYCLSDLGAPWGFEVEGAATAKFHVVLDGGCWLRLAGQEPVWLGPGDLAILPGGQRHSVSDRPDSPMTGLDQLIADHPLDTDARLVCGGGGPRTRLLCGGFTLAGGAPDTVLTLLPPVVTMTPRAGLLAAWIGPVFALARQEADAPAPGAQAIFARLADVFLTQALRAYLTGAAQAGLPPARAAGRPADRPRHRPPPRGPGPAVDPARPGPRNGPVPYRPRNQVPRGRGRAPDPAPGPGQAEPGRGLPHHHRPHARRHRRPHRLRQLRLTVQGLQAALRRLARQLPGGRPPPGSSQLTWVVWPAQNGARSWRLSSLPDPVRGSSSTNDTERGIL